MAEVEESELITGVLVVHPTPHGDARGRFIETYRRQWFPAGREMVQTNRAERVAGSLVGLHYHLHQADYWALGSGSIRIGLVDLRVDSPTRHAVQTFDLADGDLRGVFIPPGVAHGFATRADSVLNYSVDAYYNPADELGVLWNDPALGLDWGITDPVVSERDRANPLRADLPADRLPHARLRTG
jgi:dTDP-4-dehydrorhamnose 3,5-epimerase